MDEPINKDAEYISLLKDGRNILVDMNDIDDILYIQDVQVVNKPVNNFNDYYNENNLEIKKLYSVMFKDHTYWTVIMAEDDLEIFKKFNFNSQSRR